MKCEDARKELSVDSLEKADQATQAHVADCEPCQIWLAEAQGLESRLLGWRSDAPPPALQARIAAAIETPERSSRKTYFSLWKENPIMRRLSFAAALCAFAVCALFFVLSGKPASAYDRMLLAMHHVRSAHMIIWYNTAKTGPVHIEKVEEAWYQDHNWRVSYGDRPSWNSIIRGHTFYKYDEKRHKVVTAQVTGPQVTDFSLATLAGEYMPTGAHPHAELIGATSEGGKTVQEISLDLSKERERMLFWVDKSTGLPIRAEKQDLDYQTRQWVVNGRFEFEFNQSLPESLFDPQSLVPNR